MNRFKPFQAFQTVSKCFNMAGAMMTFFLTPQIVLLKVECRRKKIYQVLENLIISWGEKPDPKWIDAKVQSALKRSEVRHEDLKNQIMDKVNKC